MCGKPRTLESIVARQVPNSIAPGSRIRTKQVGLLVGILLLGYRQRGFGRSPHLGNTRSLDFLCLDRNLRQRTLDGHILPRIQSGRLLGDILGQGCILIVCIHSLGSTLSATSQRHRLCQLCDDRISHIRRTWSALIGFRRVRTQHRRRGCKSDLLGFPLGSYGRPLDLEPLHDDLLQGTLVIRINTGFTTIQLPIHHLFCGLRGRRLLDILLKITQVRDLFGDIDVRGSQGFDLRNQRSISRSRFQNFGIRKEFPR